MIRISVATDFSRYPAGRFRSDGPHSGERFREDLLVPALAKDNVTVALDAPLGYGSSFLEEAFGGLVRKSIFSESDLKVKLTIESADRKDTLLAWRYISEAYARRA